MDKMIRFSILVPVYNVETYLRQCLDSLICQQDPSYEIVLIDDGSTDTSGEICDDYQKRYPNLFRIVHKQNEGLLLARRSAIQIAKGEYFIFVDSDDFVEENMLSCFNQIINETSPDMIIYHADRYDGSNYSKFRDTLYAEDRLINEDEKEAYYRATLLHTISNGLWGKVVKRDIVDIDYNYKPLSHVSVGEDLLQSLPIITKAKRIFFTNNILYHYRTNPLSVSRVFNYRRYDSMRSVEIELNKWASNWEVSDRANLVARHALVETVWGTLRALSKSDENLQSIPSKTLIEKMSEDTYMINQYKCIKKNNLSVIQRMLLSSLYKKHFTMLIGLLKFLSIVKP